MTVAEEVLEYCMREMRLHLIGWLVEEEGGTYCHTRVWWAWPLMLRPLCMWVGTLRWYCCRLISLQWTGLVAEKATPTGEVSVRERS